MTGQVLGVAVGVEARKAVAARVVLSTTILLLAGITALGAITTAAARGGNAQILAKLGPVAAAGG